MSYMGQNPDEPYDVKFFGHLLIGFWSEQSHLLCTTRCGINVSSEESSS